MQYKMIALDMDGTLLNEAKELTLETKDVLDRLYQQGVEIVIATGRRFWYAQLPLHKLDYPVQVLANNGSVIRNSKTGERSYQAYMSRALYKGLIGLGSEHGVSPLIHVDYYEEEWDFLVDREATDPMYASYLRPTESRLRIVPDLFSYSGDRVMVLCYMGSYERLALIEKQIHQSFPGQCNTHIITSVPKVGPILEVLSDLCGKWRSLQGYANSKGIKGHEIIAIGDDMNDFEMIEKAGLGIAMQNAVPEVKTVAKRITPVSNNENGAALVLKDIFGL